jgi:hypothetical protein
MDLNEFYNMFGGIAYYDDQDYKLKYAYHVGSGGNCGIGNAWKCSTIDATEYAVGRFGSVHVPRNAQDKLQIAYYDATNGKLKYAQSVKGGKGNCGDGDFYCTFIDTMGYFYQADVSLAVDSNNYPMIAYTGKYPQFSGSPTLKVAQPVGAPGASNGNCGPPTINLTYSWKCTNIDKGSAYTDEAEYISIAFNPDGLAMIAYTELFMRGDPDVHNLKIAYQKEGVIFFPIFMK